MQSAEHPSNNRAIGAPRGWDQKELPIDALAVTDGEVNGKPCIISFWRPSAEELKQLNEGALVSLWVIGEAMPPVALSVQP